MTLEAVFAAALPVAGDGRPVRELPDLDQPPRGGPPSRAAGRRAVPHHDPRQPLSAGRHAGAAAGDAGTVLPRPDNPAWGQPTRGTHRWSFYADQRFRSWRSNNGPFTWFPREELDFLLAEGYSGWATWGRWRARQPHPHGGRAERDRPRRHQHQLRAQAAQRALRQPVRDAEVGLSPGNAVPGDVRRAVVLSGARLERRLPRHAAAAPRAVRRAAGARMACYTFGGVGGNSASPGSFYAWPFE